MSDKPASAHNAQPGSKLAQLRQLGATGFSRQVIAGGRKTEPLAKTPRQASQKVTKASRPGKNKGGRPKAIQGEPWVVEGISRRTWERRQKAKAK